MADITRIKGNIGKMIAQNAPEADIDEYLASEGLTPEALRNGGTQPSVVEDVAKSVAVAPVKAGIGLGGMVGDLSDLGAKGLEHATNFVSDKLGVERYQRPSTPSVLNNIPTSASLRKNVEGVTGELYEPKTDAGKYAGAGTEFAVSALAGPGRTMSKLLMGGMAGLGSEAAGQATEGEAAEPYARVGGGLLAGLSPAAAARAITPLRAAPARQRLVDILEGEGVTSLTAGQRTGNKSLQYAESFLGDGPGAGQSASRVQREGQEQFTRAAMRRAGQGLDDATPETLLANNQRLGNEFQTLAGRNTMTPDNQFINDVTAAVRQYRNVPDSQQARMIQGYIDDIVPYINAGGMPGAEYQAMRSRMSRQANNNRQSDPDLAEALRGFRNALDNAMGRSISPADREAWQTARREYGAQKTIEKTASRAGEATAEGQLVPSNLRNTVAAENRGAYARGQGEFSELARAGSGVMQPLPNSGTAQRNALTNMLMLPVSATAGRAIMSRPVQSYLGNQLMAGQLENLPGAREALIRALLAQDRTQLRAGPSN
jgi:hypothetical protein